MIIHAARRPFLINIIMVMPIAIQNKINPSIRFMGNPSGISGFIIIYAGIFQ